jgi:dolichol-phosphate mannosyltransferase
MNFSIDFNQTEKSMSNTNRLKHKLSIVIPCYNEEKTLTECVDKLQLIADEYLELECIIVNDDSTDESQKIAEHLAKKYNGIKIFKHEVNKGKGASLHTGFAYATGDFVAIQDADLEYDPFDLKKLIVPLINDKADVVMGSRFLSGGTHRVLYFWHSVGNSLLTLLSNMLTDLNLTDMETCYKVFKREVIQSIDLKENRFGFEPEVVAKISQKRLRVYETGISYYGRTYAEGKKIGLNDAWRALYCIMKYNLNKVPWIIQFIFYIIIGGISAVLNLVVFLALQMFDLPLIVTTGVAFVVAAIFNYVLCILILFRHKVKWNTNMEIIIFLFLGAFVGFVDYFSTHFFIQKGMLAGFAKILASGIGLFLNFAGRKWLVFPEKRNVDWKPQN